MNLLDRVKEILFEPDREWLAIEQESYDPISLYRDYIAILALIPAIAGFVGSSLLGVETPAGMVRLPIFLGLICAIYGYGLILAVVYIAAHVINWLAPRFGGEKNFPNALKLSVYCNTPFCLASLFLLVPPLKFLVVLGLYGLYLFYLGAPLLMRTPIHRGAIYAAAMFIIVFIIALPFGSVQALFWL